MIKRIDHIGIAVTSIAEALPLYTNVFQLELEGIEIVEDQRVRVAFLNAGNTKLELVEALSKDSPIAQFIEKRGEGIHHIAFSVENISSRIEEINNGGLHMIDKTARIGAHQAQIAFLHPKSGGGVLYELCEHEEEEEK
ncbi:methylmalonyl-CoA epimerase [Peribacillus huizhouensis]|uniref:Methylmalonyl-CoA/ethylmalonyl-CoA epimerase n=1 Tax=Peribacillus huizhouensis TaxID=1501239 RepID=A0ABR6CQL8_9BACI|nr:methylmalonyl-CoA epimerase [Peribacillus huizhouensis]MBA9027331.1 methylmalonyl-CoA/ethylmalonyl-CoA epimerase [Peribacillus huizhouensis]